mmetsp:Transcript_47874/g.63325  ORF Transcript_47874/g.63325 Transcript_47874/m.63325 type:complete len:81 (+) Transcript_47874:199-441(+)
MPYVNIAIIEAGDGCEDGYEPIFSRTWYGLQAACDCSNGCDPTGDQSLCFNFNIGSGCSETQERNGCFEVEAGPTIYQFI